LYLLLFLNTLHLLSLLSILLVATTFDALALQVR
jgi:hypothetical protein